MELLREYQLDIMLFMSGMCGVLAIMTIIIRSLPRKTKTILALMELSAMFLLLFDRLSYIYKGDASELGYYMVRIGNGMVFLFSLVLPFLATRYINDMLKNEAKLKKTPFQLKIADISFGMGVALLAVSQFTGIYYTFDENNFYHRSPLFIFCYVFPFLIVLMQEWTIIQYRKTINKWLAGSLVICLVLPTIMSVLQIFFYGLSLGNMTMAFTILVFYTYALNYLSESAEKAKKHELDSLKESQKKEAALFEQTTSALVNAIDAKDNYTSGHSARVATYSKAIAKEVGLSDEKCREVYFSALLHDVGKIGISNRIINKPGKLTDEEYEQIKTHSVKGNQILSSIKQAPFLATGALHHHERYDGTGYPDGLEGENIPEIARIIAVADAYDAMTSERSYRMPYETNRVIEELKEGIGTQFDPRYAEAMIRIIERNNH